MEIIYGLRRMGKYQRPVAVLGVFDGVHRGHQYILKAAVKKARAIKGTSVLLTFWPHPQKQASLYSLPHRLALISRLGIDTSIVLPFNRALAKIPAEDFLENILVKKIKPDYVYIGKNFRFGKGGSGNWKLLKKTSAIYNFRLKVFAVVRINRRPVSSTSIRYLITRGKLAVAQRLLGRPVSVFGTVIKGNALGRQLGFPTANIDPHHEVLPPSGVYAVKVILDEKKYSGLCNIGRRPTFSSSKDKNIEAYIFNFAENIYGKDLQIQFVKKIRAEKKFPSHHCLALQIKKDAASAKGLFFPH